MKRRKYMLGLILVGLPLLDVVYACCNCTDHTEEKSYKISGLSISNIDNSGVEAVETSSETVNKNAYGIRLKVDRESLALNQKHNNLYLFTAGAYAMSCDCPPETMYFPQDKVESIKIVTLNDFNDEKPANSDVTEYFKSPKDYSDVEDTIWDLNGDYGYYLQENENFDYLLMVPPTDVNTEFKFKVIITFEEQPATELFTTVHLI